MTPSVAVFGAAGFGGALSARLLHRHPAFELTTVTARSDVGRRLDDLYPHHRVPLTLEELDLDRQADVDAAIVAYPHGAAAELVSELVQRGVRVVDLSADFHSAYTAGSRNRKSALRSTTRTPSWSQNWCSAASASST